MTFPRSLFRGFVCSILLSLPLFATAPTDADKVDATRALVTQWAKVRQETIRLEAQWDTEKSLLASLEAALAARRQALEEQKRIIASQTAGKKRTHDELAEKNAAAKAGLDEAEVQVRHLTEEVVRLRPRLPPRLSHGLEMAFRSVIAADASLAERSQHLVTILNRCAQFNQAVTSGEEPVVLPGGEKLLEVVYWGLAFAYGLDRTSGQAYVGRPEADGWRWQEKPGVASAVAALIAQARDKADPAFVELPVQVKGPSS